MSKKNQSSIKKNIQLGQPKQIVVAPTFNDSKKQWLIIAGLVITTLVLFFPALFNDFVLNWDDAGYVPENTHIRKLTLENIKIIFTSYHQANYHPLTILMYAFEYAAVQAKPFLYHLNNILLHLANVALVFVFAKKLTNKIEIAIITALLFGIHPMRVESVAWISERKDVLYTFFFMLASNFYIDYVQKEKHQVRNYILSVVLIILSLLSKPAAVCFPGVVVLLDWFLNRKFSIKLLLEKIPFFVISIIFGIVAIYSQKDAGAIQNLTPIFSFFDRILLSFYALVLYLQKLIVPLGLSAMHPYPDMDGGHMQMKVYIAPLIILALLVPVGFSFKKTKMILFGTLFFLVNIALVLQLLPVGAAIIAERYSYVPYIGLFLMIGYGYVWIAENANETIKRLKPVVLALLLCWTLFLAIASFNRIKVWKRGDYLFEDILLTYQNQAFVYNNLGFLCFNQLKDYDRALLNYNRCLQIDSNFHMARRNRAILYFNIKKYNEALVDFNDAIKNNPQNVDIYLERANTFSLLNEDLKAIADYNVYMAQKKDNYNAYHWRGVAESHVKQNDGAIADFNKSLELHPNNYESYYWRGLSYYDKKMNAEAIRDLSKSIELEQTKFEVYAWRGLMYYNSKNIKAAIADYTKAIELNPNDMASIANRAISYKDLKEWKLAYIDIERAIKLGCKLEPAFYNEIKVKAGY